MDLLLPSADRRRYWSGRRTGGVLAVSSGLSGVASFHDDIDRTTDSDEENGQTREAPRAVGKDLLVVMADVDDDVQT